MNPHKKKNRTYNSNNMRRPFMNIQHNELNPIQNSNTFFQNQTDSNTPSRKRKRQDITPTNSGPITISSDTPSTVEMEVVEKKPKKRKKQFQKPSQKIDLFPNNITPQTPTTPSMTPIFNQYTQEVNRIFPTKFQITPKAFVQSNSRTPTPSRSNRSSVRSVKKKKKKKRNIKWGEKKREAFKRKNPTVDIKNRKGNLRGIKLIRHVIVERNVQELFWVISKSKRYYPVKISNYPICSCPDYEKNGNIQGPNSNKDKFIPCKHIIFVMLKILGLDETEKEWFQIYLTDDEVRKVFRKLRSRGGIPRKYCAKTKEIKDFKKTVNSKYDQWNYDNGIKDGSGGKRVYK